MNKIPGTNENRVELKANRKKARTLLVTVNFIPVKDADVRLGKVMDLLLCRPVGELSMLENKDKIPPEANKEGK